MCSQKSAHVQMNPWGHFTQSEAGCGIDGRGSAHLITLSDQIDLQLGSFALAPAGFPFLSKGTWCQSHTLPYDSVPGDALQESRENLSSTGDEICQLNLLPRPRRGKAKENDLPNVKHRDQWLRWQLNRFFELSHVDDEPEGLEAECGQFVRRSWETVQKEWIESSEDDAEISLIVRLANRDDLLQALDLISKQPRKVLERYRGDTPISQIQELDSACIRNYAHRPGRHLLEKAGARQQLQSVLRRENVDTLENRVTCWVLSWLQFESKAWLGRNSAFKTNSTRYESVQRFSVSIDAWASSVNLSTVSELCPLALEPNYPLQFEPRYQLVWKSYLDILRMQQVFEDAWTWQRVVWAESGRQIFHSFLTDHWSEITPSYPVYRSEGLDGKWVLPYRAPGPFEGPIYLYDSMDIADAGWSDYWKRNRAFPESDRIGACGCEQVLWFDRTSQGVCIWYSLWDPESSTLKEVARDAGRQLMSSVSQDCWTGLVIVADVSAGHSQSAVQEEVFTDGEFQCVAVSVPMDAHSNFDALKKGFKKALKASGGAA